MAAPVNPTASNAQDLAATVVPPQPAAATLPALIIKLQNEPWYQSAAQETQQAAIAQLVADPASYDRIMADLVAEKIEGERDRFNQCVDKYILPRFDAVSMRGISNFGTVETMVQTAMRNCFKNAEEKTFSAEQ